jgi:putative peptidoglycan lipid II flippase
VPFVLMRSITITFLSRGDTVTPIKALAVAVTVNVACKVLFVSMTTLSQVGLALATSIGAWVNLLLLVWLASRQRLFAIDPALKRTAGKLLLAALALGVTIWLTAGPVATLLDDARLRDEATLATLAVLGSLVYGWVAFALLGPAWLAAFRRAK